MHNCATCGRLLVTPPGVPCAACRAEEDAAVAAITAYLAAGGAPALAMVAQQTGLRPALLRRLAASGRVELRDGTGASGTCAFCGRPVAGPGVRACEDCVGRLRLAGPAPGRAGHGRLYGLGGEEARRP